MAVGLIHVPSKYVQLALAHVNLSLCFIIYFLRFVVLLRGITHEKTESKDAVHGGILCLLKYLASKSFGENVFCVTYSFLTSVNMLHHTSAYSSSSLSAVRAPQVE